MWFVISLGVAFFSAVVAACTKRFFGDYDPWRMSAAPLVFSLPGFALALAGVLLWDTASPTPAFWWWLALLIPLNAAGYLCHMGAVNLGSLSTTMPYLAFTPVFIIFTGWLILGETVSLWGVAGIGLVVAGSYVLNINTFRWRDVLAPARAIVAEPGSRVMLAGAFFYAWSGVLGKKIILESSIAFAACVFFLAFNVVVVAGLVAARRLTWADLQGVLSRPGRGAATGLALNAEIALHFTAITMAPVAYMIAIKRLNGLFSVLFGKLFFDDPHVRTRLAGAGIMTAGAMVLSLTG